MQELRNNLKKVLRHKQLRLLSYYLNEKTFSGPMGMGLSKSYEMGEKKICFYNTINGQEKLILNDNQKNCPQNLKKSKTLKKFNE